MYYKRGLAYSRLKRFKEAVEDYKKAMEIDPEYSETCESKGIAHSLMGNHEKAADNLKRAGILYLKSCMRGDSIRTFSMCFDLRKRIKNDNVIYSGLLLFLLTLDKDIVMELNILADC